MLQAIDEKRRRYVETRALLLYSKHSSRALDGYFNIHDKVYACINSCIHLAFMFMHLLAFMFIHPLAFCSCTLAYIFNYSCIPLQASLPALLKIY